MLKETVDRVQQKDPAQGNWCVNGSEVNVWVDASDKSCAGKRWSNVEGCMLASAKKNDTQHINLAELDAEIKGPNLDL